MLRAVLKNLFANLYFFHSLCEELTTEMFPIILGTLSINVNMDVSDPGLSHTFISPGRMRMFLQASKRVGEGSLHFQFELNTLRS
jgi:hypothetical protein